MITSKITSKPLSNPLLIVGDNPALLGGLSRIGRDLATLFCTLPEFRVGYLGRGIGNNHKLPFTLYDYPESGQWGENYIQSVWEDFSGGDNGVILTTDDPSRRHWFVNPIGLPEDLARFLGPGRNYSKWGYFPIDSTGPNGSTLSGAATDCILRYDRILAASEWGYKVVRASGRQDADWLPHGFFESTFSPCSVAPEDLKKAYGWGDKIVVGCVMANQSRKDFPAAFECFAALKQYYGNRFQAWLNTDTLIRHWNVYALAHDYRIGDCLEVTTDLSDSALAMRYSACDCTILPSSGEGFGYPILESLACGTPCVVTDYAAGQELVQKSCRVRPMTYRVDGPHNVKRAVISGYAFAHAAIPQIEEKRGAPELKAEELAQSVAHLEWDSLKHLWIRWALGGLK